MPVATVRGVHINYEVLGESGPWVALSPGGRRAMEGVEGLARKIADRGYRVLIFDRRNCGASDVVIDGEDSEYEIWADDLHALLGQLGGLPAFVGGSSAGSRLAMLVALRHPDAVRGLLLWRVTGGEYAVNRLAGTYYTEFMDVAEHGGMAAVCATPFFAERIAENPSNRDRLMAMHPARFMEVMSHWRQAFWDSVDYPVIGATEEQLASITVPVCVVPGNDLTHPRRVGENAARLLPNGELHVLLPDEVTEPTAPTDLWAAKDDELAATFASFLDRVSAAATR